MTGQTVQLIAAACAVVLIVLALVDDVDRALKTADEAYRLACENKSRLDKLVKATGLKETRHVPYDKGWSPRDSWDDDFRRTVFLTKAKRMSWLSALLRWLLRKID